MSVKSYNKKPNGVIKRVPDPVIADPSLIISANNASKFSELLIFSKFLLTIDLSTMASGFGFILKAIFAISRFDAKFLEICMLSFFHLNGSRRDPPKTKAFCQLHSGTLTNIRAHPIEKSCSGGGHCPSISLRKFKCIS